MDKRRRGIVRERQRYLGQ